MSRPLVLLAYLGSPVQNLTRANTLISTEIAAMAKICRDQGFQAAIFKTRPETPKILHPLTGVELWDGKTQPEILWLHQALPNIPGGPGPIHDHALGILSQILPGVKKIYRLVVDNNPSMSHNKLIFDLKSRAKKTVYLKNYKAPGPNQGYQDLYNYILKHTAQGTFYEVGYDTARSKTQSLNFKRCSIFSEQLSLTSEIYPRFEKTIDFCYIGASRGNEIKRKTRLSALGLDFLSHSNSFYGGSLFKTRGSIRFPRAWEMMAKSKAHLIVRDEGMDQIPLHRYLQALVHLSIPVVLNEPEEVGFIHDLDLQKMLRVKSYDEALGLLANYSEILPLLKEERDHWIKYDSARNENL